MRRKLKRMATTFAIRFSETANNLLQTFVNDGRKKFYNIEPWRR